MATTFKILNGDVVLSQATGRPTLIGNSIDNNTVTRNSTESKNKIRQDLVRGLSLERVRTGTTANIRSIIGTVPQFGASAVALLVDRQIRDMISSIVRQQSKRPNVRPPNEKIKAISTLQVFPNKQSNNTKTSFRFRLGVQSQDGGTISPITGSMV